MKFPRETATKKHMRLTQWHVWFAWFPVRTPNYWVWLEFVERIGSADTDRYGREFYVFNYRTSFKETEE